MFGQGRPNFHRHLCRCTQRRQSIACRYRCALSDRHWRLGFPFALKFAFALALFFLISPGFLRAAQQDSVRLSAAVEEIPSDLKLRFAWGGGIPQKWRGKLTIENGTFADSRVLAITSDAPSTVYKSGNELIINHRIASSYGGVDAAINLSGETAVRLNLESESGETFERSWTLDQLVAGVNESIDEQQNRISVSRTPGDRIRVNVKRPHLVFEPGETWSFETSLQRCGFADQKIISNFYWKRGNINLPVSKSPSGFTTDKNGSSESETVEVVIPDQEGAHDLWIECYPQPTKGTFGQFRRPKKITRRVQLIVVSKTAPNQENNATWIEFASFNSQQLRGNRSPWPVPRRPGSKEPVRKGDLSLVSISDSNSESAVELAPNASLTVPVPQPKNASGPIRVSLRYRSIPGTKLGVNYLSSSQQILHGMDSGVCVPNSRTSTGQQPQWLSHTFHIWPEEQAGKIFISNDDQAVKAQIGELKFESGPQRLADKSQTQPAPSNMPRRERMAFLESPDFSGLFQAARRLDPQTGQALDDWSTFHDSIDRLTQHLKANHYDGAFVTIAADGSAIFPSFGLAPGPRFDSGLFSSEGCDPIQKDVVELMLRMFDRMELKLVPVVTLNSTLQSLEALREAELMSFDLIDFEGQSVGFDRSQVPIYNPLDRTLQGVCSQSISRFADRYGDHVSFGGLALSCRPDCCTMLPGTRHGLDNITVTRFLQSVNIDPAEFEIHSLLDNGQENPVREAWLQWRSKQMSQWYNDLASSVQKRSQQKLYLLPIDIDRNNEIAATMSPSLHRSGDFGLAMKNIGLNFEISDSESVVVLAPKRIAPGLSLAQNRIGLNIDQSHTAQQFIAQRTGGLLFTHRGNWRRIDSGIPNSQTANAPRKQLYTVAGNSNRRRYIEAIRKFDSRLFIDGGHSLSFGGDESIEPILRILRELPAQRFEDIGDPGSGPVCMRQLSIDGENYFYAINDSPWPVEVTALLGQKQSPEVLQASANSNGKVPSLTTFEGTEVLLEKHESRNVIRIFLEPWSMFAGTSKTNSSFNPHAIESFQVSLPEQVDSQLRKRLYQLKSKLAKAKTAEPMSQLLNGNFESFSDPEQSGWEFGNHDQATFDLDSNEFRDGRTSLSMQTEGKPVWIRSNTLRLPETGRLSVSVWIRTSQPDAQPQPRIAVEGVSDGVNLYRFGTVGASRDNGEVSILDATWQRFVVHFDDLPLDMSNVRIGFDLMTKGQISIDQVEVFDRWFDENDSVAMTQLLAGAGSQLQSETSIDGGRRVLESYWVQFLDQYAGKEEQVVEVKEEKPRAFELPLPAFEMPAFELPGLGPKKPKRVPLLHRFQRRE